MQNIFFLNIFFIPDILIYLSQNNSRLLMFFMLKIEKIISRPSPYLNNYYLEN